MPNPKNSPASPPETMTAKGIAAVAASRPSLNDVDASLAADDDFDQQLWDHPDSRFDRHATAFLSLFRQAFRYDRLSSHEETILSRAIDGRTYPERPLASHVHLRRAAYKYLIDQLVPLRSDRAVYRRWFFITLVSDHGNAFEYDPAVNIKALTERFDRVLRKAKLNTVTLLEVQAGTNFPYGDHGRALMFHEHGIGWTNDPNFDAKQVARSLREDSRLRQWLLLPTVKLVEIPREDELRGRCGYMLKLPDVGKFLKADLKAPRGWTLKPTTIRADLSLRLMEVLTHLELPDMIKGQGEGSKIAAQWRVYLRSLGSERRAVPEKRMQRLWESYWRRSKGCVRQPFDLNADDVWMRLTDWTNAAEAWIARAEVKQAERRSAKAEPPRFKPFSVERFSGRTELEGL